MRRGSHDSDILILAVIAIIFCVVVHKTLEKHRDNRLIITPKIEKKIQGR